MTSKAENRHTKLKKVGNVGTTVAKHAISVTTRVSDIKELGVIAAGAGAAVSATGGGLVIAGGVLQVIGIGKNSVAAVKSHNHMKGLEDIQARASSLNVSCNGEAMKHQAIVASILPYLIEQKKTKRDRRVQKAIPCVGLLESIRAVGNWAWKKHKGELGKKRYEFAEILASHLTVSGCALAAEIVAELYDFESMVWLQSACEPGLATELIASKMKSV